MPGPIRHLADQVLRNPEVVRIDNKTMADTVSHSIYPVEQKGKTDLLLKMLRHTNTKSVLAALEALPKLAASIGLAVARDSFTASIV